MLLDPDTFRYGYMAIALLISLAVLAQVTIDMGRRP